MEYGYFKEMGRYNHTSSVTVHFITRKYKRCIIIHMFDDFATLTFTFVSCFNKTKLNDDRCATSPHQRVFINFKLKKSAEDHN